MHFFLCFCSWRCALPFFGYAPRYYPPVLPLLADLMPLSYADVIILYPDTQADQFRLTRPLRLNLHLHCWLSLTRSTCLNGLHLPARRSADTSASHVKEVVGPWQEATAAKWETSSSLSSCYRWMAVLTDMQNKLVGISRRDKLMFQFCFFVSCFFFPFEPFLKVYFYSNREGVGGTVDLMNVF